MKKLINNLIVALSILPTLGLAATVTLNPVADAYVFSFNPSVTYGYATQLYVRHGGTQYGVYASFLKFQSDAGQIASAKLRLYAAGNTPFNIHAVSNTNWGESTLNYYNRPGLDGILGSLTINQVAYGWHELDVTPYVQSEIAAGRSIISFGLHGSLVIPSGLTASSREGVNPPQLVLVTNDAPTASLTSPTTGSTYTAPASILLSATATDTDGSIASVEFYNGANLIGAGTLTSGSYTLDWSNVGAGSYSLTAKATDNQGAVTVSAPVTITVNPPNVPPSVSITAPTDGSSYTAPASITLSADASDSDGNIASVEFYDGTTLSAASPRRPTATPGTTCRAAAT